MNPILPTLCAEHPTFARLFQECATHQAELTQPQPRIVACGVLKAGKSSLLNALTQHLQAEYFTTDTTRATVAMHACCRTGQSGTGQASRRFGRIDESAQTAGAESGVGRLAPAAPGQHRPITTPD